MSRRRGSDAQLAVGDLYPDEKTPTGIRQPGQTGWHARSGEPAVNIRLRLITGFTLLLVSIGVLAVVSARSVTAANAASERMEHSRAQYDATLDLTHELDIYLRSSLAELMGGNPDEADLSGYREAVEQRLASARLVRDAEEELEQETGTERDEAEDALLDEIEKALVTIDASFQEALSLVLEGKVAEALPLALSGASGPTAETLSALIAAGLEDEREEVESAEAISTAASNRVTDVTRIVSAVTFGIVALLLLWTVPPLSRSLQAMHAGVERVSEGDLSSPIEVTGKHELARFSEAFNGMLEDLQTARLRQATEAEARAASRRAGMADVATGVLHNVGNVLNSLRVSVEVVRDELKPGTLDKLTKTVALLEEQGGNVGAFLAEDPRGQLVVPFLAEVADTLDSQRAGLDNEAKEMQTRLAHIEMIIGKQQQHASRASLLEWVQIAEIVDDAITILLPSFERHGVDLHVELPDSPQARLDRHQVLEMLINLLSNAKEAVVATGRPDRRVAIALRVIGDEQVVVDVIDNGVGIGEEALEKVFTYGFTTKDDGHGFGLHNAANAVKAIGGEIQAHSDGEGTGATFSLVLPINPPVKAESKSQDPTLARSASAATE